MIVAIRAFGRTATCDTCTLPNVAKATFADGTSRRFCWSDEKRDPQGKTVGKRRNRPAIDRYDLAILSALSLNTRLTTVELAQRVHLSRTAVSRRIATLKQMNVLNDAADVLNYESIGFKVRAKVEISANGRATSVIKPRLLQRPEVLSVSVMAGDGLLSLDVIAFDMDHLHSFVKSVQGEGNTTTKVVYALEKSELTLVERMQRLTEAPATNH